MNAHPSLVRSAVTVVALTLASNVVLAADFESAIPIFCPGYADDDLFIESTEDVDVFVLAGSAGEYIVIDIDAAERDSTLDPVLGVFDSSLTLIATSDDDPAPGEAATVDSYLEVVMPADGLVYIAVSSYPDFDFDGVGGTSIGPYSLFVSCQECVRDSHCADGDPCITNTCPTGSCEHSPLDRDDDGVCDLFDTCPSAANPDQQVVPFSWQVRADSFCDGDPDRPCFEDANCESGLCEKAAFRWADVAAYRYASGPFDTAAAVGALSADHATGVAAGDRHVDLTQPAPGTGLWYLFRPDCTVGSWQSSSDAEPERDAILPAAVPVERAWEVAVLHAEEFFGPAAVAGTPTPTYDTIGNVSSYLVPFMLDGGPFPSDEVIFETVETARAVWGHDSEEFYDQIEGSLGPIGTLQVAATTSDYPVFAAYDSLHTQYLFGTVAGERAQELLNAPPLFQRYVFVSPHEEFFEIVTDAGSAMLHAHTLIPAAEIEPLPFETPTVAPPVDAVTRAWDEVEATPQGTNEITLVPIPTSMPIIDWNCWCVGTAASMIAGYWDHVGPQGTHQGYGRTIDFWRERSCSLNTPNFLDELMIILDDSICPRGCAWGPNGMEDILNTLNDYNFSWEAVIGSSGTDWGWDELTIEIDAGRPAMWSVGPQEAHSMATWGYRTLGTQKFVIVYNTWGKTRSQQSREYNYDQWKSQMIGHSAVTRLVPGGGEASHAFLVYPRGGEVLLGDADLAWQTNSSAITKTSLYFSSNGGNTWTLLAADVPTVSGVNHYTWSALTMTSRGRVRIEAKTAAGTLIAGDGSFKNFLITGAPDLVPVPSAQNNFCQKDPSGRLVVNVKNQGTLAAAASTVKVVFGTGQTVTAAIPTLGIQGEASHAFDIPPDCGVTDCSFVITVDSTNVVNEAIESNNTGSGVCVG